MGFFDRLFGNNNQNNQQQNQQNYNQQAGQQTRLLNNNQTPQQPTDQQAIDRYRYLLRTAPPETIEQAHAEAFAQLTPEQRQQVLQQLGEALPANERNSAAYQSDDPQTLARMATRAEIRQPGVLERTFGGMVAMAQVVSGSVVCWREPSLAPSRAIWLAAQSPTPFSTSQATTTTAATPVPPTLARLTMVRTCPTTTAATMAGTSTVVAAMAATTVAPIVAPISAAATLAAATSVVATFSSAV